MRLNRGLVILILLGLALVANSQYGFSIYQGKQLIGVDVDGKYSSITGEGESIR